MFELNFLIEIHLNNQSLIIINHELIEHHLDLSDYLGVIELCVLKLTQLFIILYLLTSGGRLRYFFLATDAVVFFILHGDVILVGLLLNAVVYSVVFL